MSAFQSIRHYYSLFGIHGVWLAVQARFLSRCPTLTVVVPNLRHPVRLRFKTSDVSTFEQVLVKCSYDCDLIRMPQVIVDAGANVGLTAIFYANKYPGCKIIAIEPAKSNYDLLRANVADYPNITPVHAALWKENRELKVVDPGMGAWGFQTRLAEGSEDLDDKSQELSRGITISDLMNEYGLDHIDLLKIDIEGSEREVFENADAWIENVGAIAIELHDKTQPGCSRSFNQATKDFVALGEKCETVFVARST